VENNFLIRSLYFLHCILKLFVNICVRVRFRFRCRAIFRGMLALYYQKWKFPHDRKVRVIFSEVKMFKVSVMLLSHPWLWHLTEMTEEVKQNTHTQTTDIQTIYINMGQENMRVINILTALDVWGPISAHEVAQYYFHRCLITWLAGTVLV